MHVGHSLTIARVVRKTTESRAEMTSWYVRDRHTEFCNVLIGLSCILTMIRFSVLNALSNTLRDPTGQFLPDPTTFERYGMLQVRVKYK